MGPAIAIEMMQMFHSTREKSENLLKFLLRIGRLSLGGEFITDHRRENIEYRDLS